MDSPVETQKGAEERVVARNILSAAGHGENFKQDQVNLGRIIEIAEEAISVLEGNDDPLEWSRDVTELLKMYLRWNPDEESLQFRLYKVVTESNRMQRLNEQAAAALHRAIHHVRGNMNRCGSAQERALWGEDAKLVREAYDALLGYSGAPSVSGRGNQPVSPVSPESSVLAAAAEDVAVEEWTWAKNKHGAFEIHSGTDWVATLPNHSEEWMAQQIVDLHNSTASRIRTERGQAESIAHKYAVQLGITEAERDHLLARAEEAEAKLAAIQGA